MSKWYIDKIKAAAPELLDSDTTAIMDWIDNAFTMYAEDADAAAKKEGSSIRLSNGANQKYGSIFIRIMSHTASSMTKAASESDAFYVRIRQNPRKTMI